MPRALYIALSLAAAACWFGMAFGWVTPAPWVATMAFVFLGIDSLLSALRKFAEGS